MGPLPDGFEVFAPSGSAVRIPDVVTERLVWRWLVDRGIHRGIRPGLTSSEYSN